MITRVPTNGTWAGVEAKLRQARTHLIELEGVLAPLFGGDRQEFALEPEPGSGAHLLIVRGVPRPDSLWALLIGDCLHNLRSALDYLAFGIAQAHGSRPPNAQTQFPIHESARDRSGRERPLLVPEVTDPAVLGALKAVQPYVGPEPNDPTVNFPWQINKLCNIVKHRLLLAAVCVLSTDEM